MLPSAKLSISCARRSAPGTGTLPIRFFMPITLSAPIGPLSSGNPESGENEGFMFCKLPLH